MTINDFPVPQPSATLAIEGTQDLQRLLHVAVRNVTCITGRRPVIVPVSKDSPFGIYANHDLEISQWEDPWHIVSAINGSQARWVGNGASSAPNTISRQNSEVTECIYIEPRRARVPQQVSNDGSWEGQTGTGGTATVGADGYGTRDAGVNHGGRQLLVVRDNQGPPHSTNIVITQSSWIPRIFQGRQLFMRVFPYELQNMMHAFGEVRFCSADVLEFMEDAVRNITQRVALGVLTRFNTDELTVHDVSTCIRHDPRALHRLLFCLLRARQTGDDLHVARPTHREWDSFLHYATIHGIRTGDFPSLKHLQDIPLVKIQVSCNEKARSMFSRRLGKLFKLQHEQCIQSYLTDRYSRCPTAICGRRRIDLFREWLALPEYVQVTEGTLHALGNLAREAAGVLTQTALVLRYRDGLHHSYERLLIDAIGFGIGAGVLVPLSSSQTYELLRVLCEMDLAVKDGGKWSFRTGLEEEALEMNHVREAWRQLDDPDAFAAHRPFWVGL